MRTDIGAKIRVAVREAPWQIMILVLTAHPALGVNLISLGGSLNMDASHDAQSCCTAVNDNRLYVAWSEAGNEGAQIFVKHWNGSAWEQDGGQINVDPGQWAEEPSLAFIGPVACVAWSESTERAYQIHVKCLEGPGWQPVGDALVLNRDPERSARHCRLAACGTRLYAVWAEDNGTVGQIYACGYESGAWVSMGGSLNCHPAVAAGNPCLAVSGDGKLICTAWDEGGDVFVKRWNGTEWELAGDGRLNTYPALQPCLAINSSGRVLCAAWTENQGGAGQIYAKFLGGDMWQSLGTGLNVDPHHSAHSPALACAAGVTLTAWAENQQVYLKRFQEGRWQPEGASQNIAPAQPALRPSLALNAELEPCLAWLEDNGIARQVRVKKWPRAPKVTRLLAPAGGVGTACPVFEVSGINDYDSPLCYRLEVSNTDDFATLARIFDQTVQAANWSAASYASGATAVYAMQPADQALSPGRYYWRAFAYDMTNAIWSGPSTSGCFQIESVTYPAPEVHSWSHSAADQWYPTRTAGFSWNDLLPGGVYHYLFDADPDGAPQAAGTSLAACALALDAPGDGVWYFHLCVRDNADPPNYGRTAHYVVRVDTTPPRLSAVSHALPAENKVRISWTGQDVMNHGPGVSGLAGYAYAFDRLPEAAPAASLTCGAETTAAEFEAVSDGTWYFHIRACDQAGNWSETLDYPVSLAGRLLPAGQVRCLPNPVRSNTARIRYYLREAALVRLEIFTALERPAGSCEQTQPAEGTYTVAWDVSSLPNGIYFYRLRARSLKSGEEDQVVEKMAVAR